MPISHWGNPCRRRGQNGKERIFTELLQTVSEQKKKNYEVVQDPINRVLLVGTKKGTALPEDDIKIWFSIDQSF